MSKKTKKGYWVDARLLYSFILGLHADTVERRKKVKIIGSSEAHKLDGAILVLRAILEFLCDKEEYGSLRWRFPPAKTEE